MSLDTIILLLYSIKFLRPLCKTVSGGVCKFPFSFHNETFSACTDFWHHGAWCATRVDSFGQVLELGQCGEHCDFVSFVNPSPTNTTQSSSAYSESSGTTLSTTPSSSSVSEPTLTSSAPSVSTSEDGSSDESSSETTTEPDPTSDVTSSDYDSSTEVTTAADISWLGRGFSGSAPASCLTVSGPDPDRECQFPFTYQGRTYAGCTYSFGIPRSWCSTETSEAGLTLPGRWGYCSDRCPLHHDASKECLTVGGPSVGEVCVFPFVSGGKFHWGCTR